MISWIRRGRLRLLALIGLAASGIGFLVLEVLHVAAHLLNLPHPW